MIEIQAIGPDDWKSWSELRLAALAEAPFAFGSQLADWVDAPEERWRERLSAPGAYQVIASIDGTPAGMAADSRTMTRPSSCRCGSPPPVAGKASATH